MKAQLALCMKYMPAACMKSLTLTHEGWEFGFAKFQFIETLNSYFETRVAAGFLLDIMLIVTIIEA